MQVAYDLQVAALSMRMVSIKMSGGGAILRCY